MRVGLVRHFPVLEPMPRGWMTAAQLHSWRERYDRSPAQPMDVTIPADGWGRCFSSDLTRTLQTARALFRGDIVVTPLLREPDVREFATGRLLLPAGLWRWVLRLTWMSGHPSQRQARDDFLRRVTAVANLVEAAESDVLIFSHAGMMAYLRRELVRRGFSGPAFRVAEHARLYVFERAMATGLSKVPDSTIAGRSSD